MGGDSDRSSSRKTSRGQKSSSSSKHHRSGSRDKSSNRSSTSSGDKSKEKESSSHRSANSTPGDHVLDADSVQSSLLKSQLNGNNAPLNTFPSTSTRDDFTVTSDSSFDPIALANQRTNHYAQQQQQHPPKEQPIRAHQTLIGSPEAPSRGSNKKSPGGLLASPKRSNAMLSVSSTKGRLSSDALVNGAPALIRDTTIIAHDVVPLGVDNGVSNVRELNANINFATMDVDRIAEENRAFQAQLQAQNEAERLRMIQENEQIQREMRENIQQQKETQQAEEDAKREKQRRYMKILLFIFVVAVIGIGAYFGASSSSQDPPSDSVFNPTPSALPTGPNDANARYNPPNAEECGSMKKGLPRGNDDYQRFLYRKFDVVFYAQVSSDVSSSSTVSAYLLSALKQQIERLLRPEILGCSTMGGRRRNLISLVEQQSRRELSDFDYLIYDLDVSLAQDTESTCTVNDEQSTEPCHVLVASMGVWLQWDEPSLLVRGHIFDLLNTLDLPLTLELESQFDTIEVKDVRNPSNAPTKSPVSSSPTSSPVGAPSNVAIPTVSPSNVPTPELSSETSRLPSLPSTSPSPTTADPGNTSPNTGSCDFSAYFKNGFYYEHDGGLDQVYVVDCSIFQGTRGLAFAVDESTCNFACVGRREPQAFGPYCYSKPVGTTIQLRVNGDNTGSKLYLGTDSNSAPGGPLDCDPFMTIVS